MLFLAAGVLVGDGVLGVVQLRPGDALVTHLAELALFSVSFTDGQRVGLRDLAADWRLPGRALLLGMPSTFLVSAGLGLVVAGLGNAAGAEHRVPPVHRWTQARPRDHQVG